MEAKVKNYMSTNVITVSPEQAIEEILELMRETDHDAFPVLEGGRIVGIVTTRDLVFKRKGYRVSDYMSDEVVVTSPDKDLTDVARVMFRTGYSRLPVVDEEKRLIGIITNADVIRSHIERATPEKVQKLALSLEKLHAIKTVVRVGKVRIAKLVPTQGRIQPDEFKGREYEMLRGLAEPVVVIKSGEKMLLVDGHHRALAARKLGIEELDAYIIVPSKKIEFGLEKMAKESGLNSVDDMEIVDEGEEGITKIIKYRGER